MPPRKNKIQKEIAETPVVFFLKITDIESVVPADEEQNYSDILNTTDTNHSEKFNTDLLKNILDKVVTQKYSVQTACFWCCHTFNWQPAVLPISYDAYKNIYICQGNFCSPECSLAYNYSDNKISDSTCWNRHALLNHLYSFLYSDRMLSPAPPRSLLRLFGGPLDIQQYRDHLNGQNDIILSDIHPIRLQFPSMNVQGPLRDIKKYVSLSVDTLEKASEQLRLKRNKPANINIPTLDMCIKKS